MGGNLFNYLRDFKEGIGIRTLFSWDQCAPCMALWRGRIKVGYGGFLKHSTLWIVGIEDFLGEMCVITLRRRK